MYIPSQMAMPSATVVHELIEQFSFGIVVSDSLDATHLPFLLKADEGESGALYSHFAKANPHWTSLAGTKVVVIFSGPHSYISPLWYKNTPAVPTWNYAAVHCYGEVVLLDANETQNMLEETIKKYDPKLLNDKAAMPDEFRDRLATAIVGFKVVIDKIEGKLKLGQNRKIEDQQSVYTHLAESESTAANMLADFIANRLRM